MMETFGNEKSKADIKEAKEAFRNPNPELFLSVPLRIGTRNG